MEGLVCPVCGSILEKEIESGVYKCKYCGSLSYSIDKETNIMLTNALQEIKTYNFERADNIYTNISNDNYDKNPKAYVMAEWGRLLSSFGIVYIKGFASEIPIPTFSKYNPYINSIKASEHYDNLIEANIKENEKKEYLQKVNELDEIYKKIKIQLDKGFEYDVFICTKISVTTERNPHLKGYTRDSKIAERMYDILTRKGLKVFYSDRCCQGIEYDSQIISALERSKTLLVISTEKEYLESCWVQSEWQRWLNFIKVGEKKKNSIFLYFPDYDKDPFSLPVSLARKKIQYFSSEDILDLPDLILNTINEDKIKEDLRKKDLEEKEKLKKELEELKLSTQKRQEEERRLKEEENKRIFQELEALKKIQEEQRKEDEARKKREEEKALNNEENQRILKELMELKKALNNSNKIVNEEVNSKELKPLKVSDLNEQELEMIESAKNAYQDGEYEKAAQLFSALALRGSIEGSEMIGTMLYLGLGIKQNYDRAVKYLSFSIENGGSGASLLGLMYYKGEGVPKDFNKAVYYWQKGVASEDEDAYYGLGICYINGEGITKDYKKGIEYLKIAASKDNEDAILALKDLEEYPLKKKKITNPTTFEEHLELAQDGNANSQNEVGIYYRNKGEYQEALKWFIKSSEQNNHDGLASLAYAYESGQGVNVDYHKAFEYFKKSAELGNSFSQYYVGYYYEKGRHGEVNLALAKEWYQKAANQNQKDAIEGLQRLEKDSIVLNYPDFEINSQGELMKYKGTNKKVVIPNHVKSINIKAFLSNKNIVEVILPEGLINLGANVFYNCFNLISITLPSTLKTIAAHAFMGCNSIYQIYNNSSLNIIPGSANFYNLSRNAQVVYDKNGVPKYLNNVEKKFIKDLNGFNFIYDKVNGYVLYKYLGNEKKLSLPSNINGNPYSIGNYAFYNNDNLETVIISKGIVKTIGTFAFNNCPNLKKVSIPEGIDVIDNNAFGWCKKLVEVDLPSSLKKIEAFAFEYCKNLSKIDLKSNLTHIGASAFQECSALCLIFLPSNIFKLGQNIFYHCSKDLIIYTLSSFEKGYHSFDKDWDVREETRLGIKLRHKKKKIK